MENETVKKEENTKLSEKKSTYVIFIFVAAFLLNLFGGDISIPSIIGTSIGSVIFAYPTYYIYQAIRYKRLGVGDKTIFEIGVLRVASVMMIIIGFSILRVIFS